MSFLLSQLQSYYNVNRSASRGDPQALFQSTNKLFRNVSPATRSRLSNMLNRSYADGGTVLGVEENRALSVEDRSVLNGCGGVKEGCKVSSSSASSSTMSTVGGVDN